MTGVGGLAATLARAGGGHGFSGGGSSGGGGGGGGGGSFGAGGGGVGAGGIGYYGPSIAVVVLIVVALVALVAVRAALGARGGGASEPAGGDTDDLAPVEAATGVPQVDEVGLGAGLDAIRAHDPGFDPDRFRERVRECFLAVQRSWSDRDPRESRLVLSISLWHAHRIQILTYRNLHKRNLLDGLEVTRITLLAATSGSVKDTITVRIQVRSADYDVDDRGRIIRGDRVARPWAEDWVFQRSSRATTPRDPAGAAPSCPNCQAPLQLDDDGNCTYCDVAVMASDADWTVVRIEQITSVHEQERLGRSLKESGEVISTASLGAPMPHRAPAPAAAAGVDLGPISAADPAFEPHDFLAMARAAYLKVESSLASNEPEEIRGLVEPPLWESLRADAAANRAAHRHHQLRGLELKDASIVAAAGGAGSDRLTVRLRPRGGDCVVDDRTGEVVAGEAAEHDWIEEWVFERPTPQGSFRPPWLVAEMRRPAEGARAA